LSPSLATEAIPIKPIPESMSMAGSDRCNEKRLFMAPRLGETSGRIWGWLKTLIAATKKHPAKEAKIFAIFIFPIMIYPLLLQLFYLSFRISRTVPFFFAILAGICPVFAGKSVSFFS